MAKKKWIEKRNYDLTTNQKKFEQYLSDNGFQITGYRYYMNFNEYRIEKDGCQVEYRIHNGNNPWKPTLACFLDYWETCAKYHIITENKQ